MPFSELPKLPPVVSSRTQPNSVSVGVLYWRCEGALVDPARCCVLSDKCFKKIDVASGDGLSGYGLKPNVPSRLTTARAISFILKRRRLQ